MANSEFLAALLQRSLPVPQLLLLQSLVVSWLPLPHTHLLFPLTLACSLILRRNYFWWAGLILHLTLSPYLRALNLLIGLATCTNPLSTILYFYVAGRLLLLESRRLSMIYSAVIGASVLLYLYQRLPAKAKEVKGLFQAVGVIWVAGLVDTLHDIYFQSRMIYLIELTLILPLTYLVSELVISTRLQHTIEGDPTNLQYASHALIYIEDQRSRLSTIMAGLGIEELHKRECRDSSCFCRQGKIPCSGRQFY